MEIQRKIIESKLPPANKNVWWYNPYEGVINKYNNGSWVSIDTKKPLPSDPIVPSGGLEFPEELSEKFGMVIYSDAPFEVKVYQLPYEPDSENYYSNYDVSSTEVVGELGTYKVVLYSSDDDGNIGIHRIISQGGMPWFTIFLNVPPSDFLPYSDYYESYGYFSISTTESTGISALTVHLNLDTSAYYVADEMVPHGILEDIAISYSEYMENNTYNVCIWNRFPEGATPVYQVWIDSSESEGVYTIFDIIQQGENDDYHISPQALYIVDEHLQSYKDNWQDDLQFIDLKPLSSYEKNVN